MIAAACVMTVRHGLGQTMQQEPKTRTFHSRIGGDWLKVERHNRADDPDLWHPSYVNLVSAYKPIVTKRGESWEVNFVSEVAEHLP